MTIQGLGSTSGNPYRAVSSEWCCDKTGPLAGWHVAIKLMARIAVPKKADPNKGSSNISDEVVVLAKLVDQWLTKNTEFSDRRLKCKRMNF
jgi:hypothetical protein